jgi:hypothetical protein
MDIVLFGIGVVGLVALGSAVTFLIGSRVTQSVLRCAQEHGRFAGLSANSASASAGRSGGRAIPARVAGASG